MLWLLQWLQLFSVKYLPEGSKEFHTWILYAETVWWLESFMLMTSLQFLVVWVLFKKKRIFIPADARAFLSEVIQPATQGVFVDDGGSFVAFELGQPPFSYLLVHVSIFYWSLQLAPGPSNTELHQGRLSNWRRQNPRYFVCTYCLQATTSWQRSLVCSV